MGRILFQYLGSGAKTIWANRQFLMRHMGNRTRCCLLDAVEVTIGEGGVIERVMGWFHYDPSRSGYFEDHVRQVFPGLGGDGEFMAQVSAATAVMVGSVKTIVLFKGADRLRVYYPITKGADLLCIATPKRGKRYEVLPSRYRCKIYRAREYEKYGDKAKLFAKIEIWGQAVAP